MKDSLLLIMTPNMSLEAWNKAGLLSREMDIYNKICARLGMHLTIFSYGRNDLPHIPLGSKITVLEMPKWIPSRVPFRLQNLIYQFVALFIYHQQLKRIKFSKTNQFAASPFGLILKVVYGLPLIIRMGFYHTHLKSSSWFSKLLERFYFISCDKILVTSIDARNYIKTKYNIRTEKIKCICNSIDMDLFKPITVPKEYDVLVVGRLAEVKNISLLLEFLEKTVLRVQLIGDGDLYKEIASVVDTKPNISWSRRIDNKLLPIYYNKAKTYILISKYEGNPKSLLEAMACGLPCVGTDVNGIKECIEHGWNGLLIDSDVTSLENAINLLLIDTKLADQLSLNAFNWIRKECDMNENISREVEFYKPLSCIPLTTVLN
jgi:glycosyltransferase involved in cell wall biosynthesis